MAQETKPFQLILLTVFGAFILFGVIIFATFDATDPDDPAANLEPVSVWGTLDKQTFVGAFESYVKQEESPLRVNYSEIPPESFDQAFIEALASGRGPDMILVSQERITRHEDKIVTVPYESFEQRAYKDAFIDEAELYLTAQGILAFPFSVDPLVLYWNKALLANAGFAAPPETWDDLLAFAETVSERSDQNDILLSAIGLGEYRNITNAKEILAALFLQTGDSITARTDTGVVTTFGNKGSTAEAPAVASVRFYTEFSNPAKRVYSWNRSLPSSQDMFLSGDLALYIGFASEYETLRARNPNLDFDVARLPQVVDASRVKTFGRMHGLSVVRASNNQDSAFVALGELTNPAINGAWESWSGLPPIQRGALGPHPSDAAKTVFRASALIAQGFLDPDAAGSDAIFARMIEDVTAGIENPLSAVRRASEELEILLR